LHIFLFIMLRPPRSATLFPYTTLFRSVKDLDGLLIIHGLDRAELLVLNDPVWLPELHLALTEARARAKLRAAAVTPQVLADAGQDRKSTRLNSSHRTISYAVFCLKKKN